MRVLKKKYDTDQYIWELAAVGSLLCRAFYRFTMAAMEDGSIGFGQRWWMEGCMSCKGPWSGVPCFSGTNLGAYRQPCEKVESPCSRGVKSFFGACN